MHCFADDNRVPWVDFVKGQHKDDVMHEHLARFTGTEGVLFVGREASKRHDQHGDSYPWIVPSTGLVNHVHFYCVDEDFGPRFLEFCSYFPYNGKLWLQRARVGQTPSRPGRHRVRGVGHRRRRRRRRGAGELRSPGPR